MNAPLGGAEPDRQRYRGWIIEWVNHALVYWHPSQPNHWFGAPSMLVAKREIADLSPVLPTPLDEDEDGDPNEPDEGPAVIYSAEEEMGFIAEAERREMYEREEYEENE